MIAEERFLIQHITNCFIALVLQSLVKGVFGLVIASAIIILSGIPYLIGLFAKEEVKK
jgi:hypothetical protein